MGNILRYFLDKYGRLYDKKARFLSEPSLYGRTACTRRRGVPAQGVHRGF